MTSLGVCRQSRRLQTHDNRISAAVSLDWASQPWRSFAASSEAWADDHVAVHCIAASEETVSGIKLKERVGVRIER